MAGERLLVTGAAGFLGYHLCRALVAGGVLVRGIDIAPFEYEDLSEGVDFFLGDIRDSQALGRAMEGARTVVHCAAALPLWSRDEIFSVNVEGTRNVLGLALQRGVERVIFISSTAVYGIPEQHPVDEAYPLVGVGPYGESKIAAEKVCREYREKGLCVSILRPKSFAGPMRLGVFQILCDWVQDGRNVPIVGSGNNGYQLLHVDDLVTAIQLVMHAPAEKANDTFNVGATEFTTMKQDLQALLDYAGYGKHVVAIPSWLVIPVLKVLESVHLSPLYEWIYETADKDHYVSVDKLRQSMGWDPLKSTADVWLDTYKWYAQEYRDRKVETGISHRVGWKQGALGLVKHLF
ncbi:MAG: NAD(P)-dependent oxidoreductase [Dehalococcoidia bacterium]|nr:NAD(P)-dependent oxidoreductase [Dehalococcoidia bacterium]